MKTTIACALTAVSLTALAEAPKIRVACIGDSITAGYAMTNAAAESYPVQLQRILGPKYDVRNFGDSGSCVYSQPTPNASGWRPHTWRTGKMGPAAYAFKPDIVVCNLGANDMEAYLAEYVPDGKGRVRVESGLFRREYDDLLWAFGGAEGKLPRYIIWTRLGPIGRNHRMYGKPNPFVMERDLKAVAADVGAETLDMYTPLLPYVDTPHFCADGIHPEGGAQRVIAEVTAKTILGEPNPAGERPEKNIHDDMQVGFPKIVKNGATSPNGEVSPFVWKGRLMRSELVDGSGGLNCTNSQIRTIIRDVETGKILDEKGFAHECYYTALYCENGRAYVTGVMRGVFCGGTGYASGTILLYESDDLVHWSRRVLFEDRRFRFFNTTLTKGPDGYVLGLETNDRKHATVPFTMFFATSKDMKAFKLMDLSRAYPKNRYCGGPFLRYYNGWYYLSLVTELPCWHYCTYFVRTRDFKSWEQSKYNPVVISTEEDRTISPHAVDITPAKAEKIRHGYLCNASDFEMCEFKGRTYITYLAGNQLGHGYMCDAWYDGPMGQFLENLFK